ncbi:vesicle transport through interaction with t-SNAREs homolog 1A [Agrilus planipennis]|uniref:Vesicle transport through interaction with t-SNAREs homolog 1A n=1 Tax=Agrilus planipennis TaxID=224129 RepID=A0A1W4WCP8_AGRPL|nr:vesicle transport through interaction with t-SNAREs homolog 1A [Agrilus planipennis]
MVSLFENYEQQYSALTADITSQIGLLRNSGLNRRQLISNIEKNVEEAQELLEQMDLEIRDIEASKKQRSRTKLECYRAELKRLTLEYIKARSIKQGTTLNYDSPDEYEDVQISINQKKKLLNNSEKLERTGKKLDDGYKVIIETHEIGTQVLQNLNEQRETIQRSRNRLRETNEELGRSSRIAGSMLCRSIQERVVLFVAIVSFVMICIGLFLRFKD